MYSLWSLKWRKQQKHINFFVSVNMQGNCPSFGGIPIFGFCHLQFGGKWFMTTFDHGCFAETATFYGSPLKTLVRSQLRVATFFPTSRAGLACQKLPFVRWPLPRLERFLFFKRWSGQRGTVWSEALILRGTIPVCPTITVKHPAPKIKTHWVETYEHPTKFVDQHSKEWSWTLKQLTQIFMPARGFPRNW